MRIALDTTGGDFAPEVVIQGALEAVRERGLSITLLGDREKLDQALSSADRGLVSVVHAPELITSDEEPVMAIRRKRQSPLVVGCQMIKDGSVQALVTAGNTGAFMAAGMFVAGRITGIERPALAPLFPTENGRGVVVLDVGANMDAKPQHLLQYGIMGSLYAERVLGRKEPKVALLNVGSEPGKGNQAAKDAYILLAEADINFIGNLEARELLTGSVDVVVCDGFTGNVVLKFMEGMASSLFSMMRTSFTRDTRSKLGALLLKPALRDFKDSLDYSGHGGAPLLGLRGILVKCHGSSNAVAIKNGIYQAQKFVEQDVVRAIEDSTRSSSE
ncbi:MAG TPA: phosphate acyltransferase PlsX [Bacillota bacterium]|nr:phosphate acyltransferase PlsX [Bacillota bacterium]